MKLSRLLAIGLCLSMLTCTTMKDKTSTNKDYSGSWQKVDSLTQKGLYQSAWDEVNLISEKAEAESNLVEQTKSLYHQLRYSQMIEEDSDLLGIQSIETRLLTTKDPFKAVLHHAAADLYWQKYNNVRYQLYDRKEISDKTPEDINLWSAANFIDKISEHYNASFTSAEELKAIKLEDIDKEFFQKNSKVDLKYRVSLYDLLAQKALSFYSNSESGLTRPAELFDLDKENYFSSLSDFLAMSISSGDNEDFKYKSLKLYQEILSYYNSISAIDPLLDTELKRLSWIHQNSTRKNKSSLYESALTNLSKRDPSNNITAEVLYEKALLMQKKANEYDPLISDETNRWKLKETIIKLDKLIETYPDCLGSDLAKNTKQQILRKTIAVQNEKVVVPNVASLLKLDYSNLDKVYCRVVKTNWNHRINYRDNEQKFKRLFDLDAVEQWVEVLVASEDHHKHQTEIIVPKLPTGHYSILICSDPEFKSTSSTAIVGDFWSTHIGVMSQNDQGESKFRLTNVLNGEAINNAEIQQLENVNNRYGEDQKWDLVETYTSDKNGEFRTLNFEGYRNYLMKIKWNGEEVAVSHYSNGNYGGKKRERLETHFFIDRGIYRPGQKIHFKAIVLKRKGKEVDIAKDQLFDVKLRDANNQEVAQLSLRTNKFGTVNGSFTIPDNGLTGFMTLRQKNGSKRFSVEEYKRPKFEVSTEPVQGSFKLGERIKIEGSAIAFSGANLQDAEVKYTVYRSPQVRYFNWWNRCYIPPYAYSEKVKIKDAIVQTDKEGKFSFEFEALDGGDANEQWLDSYNYAVSIDVTDVNGETQFATTNIVVGNKALVLDLGSPNKINLREDNEFVISANNLNGEPVDTKGKIELFKLVPPADFKVDRHWRKTDQFNYEVSELNEKIPFMADPGQSDKTKWKRELVKESYFDTGNKKELDKDFFKNVKDGEFLLKLTANDNFGTDVEQEKFLKLFDPNSRRSFSNSAFEYANLESSYLPGEEVRLLLNTSLEDLKLKIEVERDERIVKEEYLLLTKGKKTYTLPIKKDYQGGVTIHLSGYKNNRLINESINVIVPRIDKKLTLSLETFRNKMLPGSMEEWKIKVKADNGDKVVSEVLLNMYDASLDAFVANYRSFSPFRNHNARMGWRNGIGVTGYGDQYYRQEKSISIRSKEYPFINTYGFGSYGYSNTYGWNLRGRAMPMAMDDSSMEGELEIAEVVTEQNGVSGYIDKDTDEGSYAFAAAAPKEQLEKPNSSGQTSGSLSPRTNFNETAFFYPDLMTDANGNLIFKFTLPESLTSWKFQAFAHSEKLQYGMLEQEMISQKDLMVVPNMPRFLRESDEISLRTKIVNLSDKDMTVKAGIKLFDAFTMTEITDEFIQGSNEQNVELNKKGQAITSWDLKINDKYQAVTWRVYANGNTHSDAEENSLPVLSNRSLVTETLPFALTNKKELTLSFEKLKINTSSTLKNHAVTLEYNGNPVWYAVQAMPYMMEYPHDCAEQIFTRYYANSLSEHIMSERPQIQRVIENWQKYSPESFLSNLEKNQELKSIVLNESPWVLDAQDEGERKKRISLLFDLNHMANQKSKASNQLKQAQLPSGAWPWFKGMRPNLYITQHIVSGFGHMDKLNVKKNPNDESMIMRGLDYLDAEHLTRYRKMKRTNWDPKVNRTGNFEIQYLYARSFFPNQNFRSDREAYDFYSNQAAEFWTSHNTYMKGMIALVMHRQGKTDVAKDILKSLLETSINSEELGMYWKTDTYSWNWYEPSTEKHALLIEAFNEINSDQATVNSLKTWLILNKRTSNWKTTKATAEACYALLLQGSDWTQETSYEITLGDKKISSSDPEIKKEAGTGYIKKAWSGTKVTKDMADITIKKQGDSPSWGAVYWQYFENLDKITSAGGPLNISKEVLLVTETLTGEKLVPLDQGKIKVGDRVRVRLSLTTDRNMDYVHIKDQRASSFEPLDVISQYKYQGGLGYYQSTKDAGTHFYIDRLRKGTYVMEYDLIASHAGELSNGFALVECMYAPEFASHSEGLRMVIEQ